MPKLGAHMSTAGGLHNIFEHMNEIGGESLQIFTKNQRQWKAKEISADEVEKFQKLFGEKILAI